MPATMIENRLSRLLGERRMSVSELQRRTGLAYTTLHSLYHGRTDRIDLDTLDRICRALGVGVGDILEYREATEGSTDA